MDVIPLDATLVRGSHGRPGLAGADDGPLFLTRQKALLATDVIESTDVYSLLLAHLGVADGR
jgi:hypothetical protein